MHLKTFKGTSTPNYGYTNGYGCSYLTKEHNSNLHQTPILVLQRVSSDSHTLTPDPTLHSLYDLTLIHTLSVYSSKNYNHGINGKEYMYWSKQLQGTQIFSTWLYCTVVYMEALINKSVIRYSFSTSEAAMVENRGLSSQDHSASSTTTLTDKSPSIKTQWSVLFLNGLQVAPAFGKSYAASRNLPKTEQRNSLKDADMPVTKKWSGESKSTLWNKAMENSLLRVWYLIKRTSKGHQSSYSSSMLS